MTSYHCDGSCDLVYDNGRDTEQSVDLHTVESDAMQADTVKFIVLINPLLNHQPILMLLLFYLRFAIHQCIEQRDLLMT